MHSLKFIEQIVHTMHELPITESIRDLAIQYAERAGAKRITDIYLVIGELSSVVDESVQFYWDILSEGTIAEGGRLHFQVIPAKLVCNNCGETYMLNHRELTACPKCDSAWVNVVTGNEFQLESIEVES